MTVVSLRKYTATFYFDNGDKIEITIPDYKTLDKVKKCLASGASINFPNSFIPFNKISYVIYGEDNET